MPQEVKDHVASKKIKQQEYTSLEEVLPESDVVYMTRIQKERFKNIEDYKKSCGLYIITPQLMTKAKKRMIVMHPLPRLNEIEYVLGEFCRVYFNSFPFLLHFVLGEISTLIQGQHTSAKLSVACMFEWHC